jgi:hypothetical protein
MRENATSPSYAELLNHVQQAFCPGSGRRQIGIAVNHRIAEERE